MPSETWGDAVQSIISQKSEMSVYVAYMCPSKEFVFTCFCLLIVVILMMESCEFGEAH